MVPCLNLNLDNTKPMCKPELQRSLLSALIVAGALLVASIALANDLDVPVLEQGGGGQAANCWSATVSGLKASGDGFLAVRSGPGSQYRKIDELHNGEIVDVFESRGHWAGVVYRTPNTTCHSTKTRPVPYDKKGWIRSDWLKDVAG
ncbi:MAG: SH3 domain-containing protein [Methylocella sp.]